DWPSERSPWTASPRCDQKWAVFYSRPGAGRGLFAGERRGLVAGERAQVQLAAIGVDRDLVAAEERVAEDAVEARTRVVQHDRRVAELERAHPQRAHDGRGARRAAAQRLQLDRDAVGAAGDAEVGGQRRREHRHAGAGVDEETAAAAVVEGHAGDPDAEP